MRALLLLLTFIFALPLSAHAERVMEVQGITIEKRDGSGRDGAVIEATRQAAAQVWEKLGHAPPAPDMTPAQLQSLTSYLDIASESVQSNYYAGTFNIGIRVSALARLGGATDNTDIGSSYSQQNQSSSVAPPATDGMPQWVLVIPARETAGVLQLWTPTDPWTQAWNHAATSSGLSTAPAGGDETDQKTLTVAAVEGQSSELALLLNQLAQKYRAPAVALIILTSSYEPMRPNQELSISVNYMERDQSDLQTADSTLFVSPALMPSIFPAAVQEARRLLHNLASGTPTAPQPGAAASVTPVGTPGLTGNYATTYANTAAPATPTSGSKLWVRIPLATPADLATYRQKINSIPGARFEVTALNRMYVEGNILYSGSQQQLLQELSTHGLRQQ